MKCLTYGNLQDPVLVMIHGNLTSAWTCFANIIPELSKEYYLVIPCIDGFCMDDTAFSSVQDVSEEIEQHLLKEYPNGVYAIYGISMGATIAVNILAAGRIKINKAFIDAPFCKDMGHKAAFWTCVFVRLSQLLRVSFSCGRIKQVICKRYPSAQMLYSNCTAETEKNVCRSVYHYSVPKTIKRCKSEVFVIYGSKENYLYPSIKRLKKCLQSVRCRRINGAAHTQFLVEHPEEYSKLLLRFLKQTSRY